MTDLRKEFNEKGYVVLKNIIDLETSNKYIAALKTMDRKKKKDSWTIPDGLCQQSEFWDIIFDPKVIEKVKNILGDDVKFLQHNDLHHGYSSFAWHRDSINRTYEVQLPDWKEQEESYQLVRCGFYFQPEENNFELGVLPGSHKPNGFISKEEFFEQDSLLSNVKNIKAKIGLQDKLKEKAHWIKTAPGDCVIFDPRLIHTGSEFAAQKFSIFTAYGIPNNHFKRHYTYYRHLRYDLEYADYPQELKERLVKYNLYMNEKKYVDTIEGAWIPSKAFSYISKLLT